MQSYSIILLAAGASTRLGKPKQLLQYQGETLLRHAVEAASQGIASPVIVVLGANEHLLKNEVSHLAVRVTYNREWEEGMASSIRCGLSALLQTSAEVDNVILMVCDQPFASASLLNDLIAAHEETLKGIIASGYNNTLGTPVLFNKKYFDDLLKLQGAEGAKKIIMKYADDVATVPFPMGAVDIDTIEDYDSLLHNSFVSP